MWAWGSCTATAARAIMPQRLQKPTRPDGFIAAQSSPRFSHERQICAWSIRFRILPLPRRERAGVRVGMRVRSFTSLDFDVTDVPTPHPRPLSRKGRGETRLSARAFPPLSRRSHGAISPRFFHPEILPMLSCLALPHSFRPILCVALMTATVAAGSSANRVLAEEPKIELLWPQGAPARKATRRTTSPRYRCSRRRRDTTAARPL